MIGRRFSKQGGFTNLVGLFIVLLLLHYEEEKRRKNLFQRGGGGVTPVDIFVQCFSKLFHNRLAFSVFMDVTLILKFKVVLTFVTV